MRQNLNQSHDPPKFLILNGPRDSRTPSGTSYRGTYRMHPRYFGHLPRNHELNQFFLWFLEEGGESGVIENWGKAAEYVNALNKVAEAESFELIEITLPNATPRVAEIFLGLDISSGYNSSLLWWGLRPTPSLQNVPASVTPLLELLGTKYAPALNSNGLFESFDIAEECLSLMDAVQDEIPSFFEGVRLGQHYSPLGIHLVSCPG